MLVRPAWERLSERWDIVVIGGGITGAGILLEAARRGYRALLLEQRDFAWGTSSRSGKLVHGGLRYLKQGQVRLTWHSVRERERLLREEPGLIEPLGILMPVYAGAPMGGSLLRLGLWLYDSMALSFTHRAYDVHAFHARSPHARLDGLRGALGYRDALTDDARLVLRILEQASALGAAAFNYARVEGLLCARSGRAIEGVAVRDVLTGRTAEVRARLVVSAAGIWTDGLRREWLGRAPKLRLLRGSHLVFPAWRLPVAQGVNLFHPRDGRPLYVLPWEGVTLVGTTDLDHAAPLDDEPAAAPEEVEYLLEAVGAYFPELKVSERDVRATFSGVRPVVGTGKADPSKESREHVVWDEGVITVTGGKLTTYGLLARDVLRHAARKLGPAHGAAGRAGTSRAGAEARDTVRAAPAPKGLAPWEWARLVGRYGEDARALIEGATSQELECVPGTPVLWAELRWAAAHEAVAHLDDLLLRRQRLGLLLPGGGQGVLRQVRGLVQQALGWDDARWETEQERYLGIWRRRYAPPGATVRG